MGFSSVRFPSLNVIWQNNFTCCNDCGYCAIRFSCQRFNFIAVSYVTSAIQNLTDCKINVGVILHSTYFFQRLALLQISVCFPFVRFSCLLHLTTYLLGPKGYILQQFINLYQEVTLFWGENILCCCCIFCLELSFPVPMNDWEPDMAWQAQFVVGLVL